MKKRKALEQLSKKDLIDILELVDASLRITNEKDLYSLIKSMDSLIPHDFGICGLTEISGGCFKSVIEMMDVSYPQNWMQVYFDNHFQYIDPILRQHFSTGEPQIWSQTYQRYTDTDPRFFDLSREFGLYEGISYGIVNRRSCEASIFSFSSSYEKPVDRDLTILSVVIPHLHEALVRISRAKNTGREGDEDGPGLPLSVREKEILEWLKSGKTNWEISRILGISERTAKFHVCNIMRKLDAVNRGHAVAKAFELKIVSL